MSEFTGAISEVTFAPAENPAVTFVVAFNPTLNVSGGGGGGLTTEQVQDVVGAQLVTNGSHTGLTATYDDAGGGAIDLAVTITQYTDEMARDALAAALVAGSNVTITPNDGANTITIAASGGGDGAAVIITPTYVTGDSIPLTDAFWALAAAGSVVWLSDGDNAANFGPWVTDGSTTLARPDWFSDPLTVGVFVNFTYEFSWPGLTQTAATLGSYAYRIGDDVVALGFADDGRGVRVRLARVTGDGATTGQVPVWDGSAWVPDDVSGGGGGTVDVVSNVATSRILGRVTSGSGDSEELTASQVKTLLAIASTDVSGLGDAATKNVGTTTGTVAAGDDSRLSDARTPTAHTHDVVSNVAADRILGRTTAGSGDSEELTAAQVRTLLNVADGATAGIAASLIDAKGDLIVGSAADTAARLAVGANGYTPVATSGATVGVEWRRAWPTLPCGSADDWFGEIGNPAWSPSSSLVAGYIMAKPFYVGQDCDIDQIFVRSATANASATVRLGLYLPDGTGGYPGTLISGTAHSGTISTSSTGRKSASITASLKACMIWAVSQTGGAATGTTGPTPTMALPSRAADAGYNAGLYAVRSDAALPSDLTGTSWTRSGATVPHQVGVRIA